MPTVAEICGIVIKIFREVGAPHHQPHITVSYEEYKANYNLNGERIAGRSLPLPQERILKKLIANHQEEFLSIWNNLNSENPQPLKKFNL